MEEIIGKYRVGVTRNGIARSYMITDNPREAVWEANKDPKHRFIENLCGSRQFYLDGDRWRSRNIE